MKCDLCRLQDVDMVHFDGAAHKRRLRVLDVVAQAIAGDRNMMDFYAESAMVLHRMEDSGFLTMGGE